MEGAFNGDVLLAGAAVDVDVVDGAVDVQV